MSVTCKKRGVTKVKRFLQLPFDVPTPTGFVHYGTVGVSLYYKGVKFDSMRHYGAVPYDERDAEYWQHEADNVEADLRACLPVLHQHYQRRMAELESRGHL